MTPAVLVEDGAKLVVAGASHDEDLDVPRAAAAFGSVVPIAASRNKVQLAS